MLKILDYTNKNFEDIQFNNETLIIMAHQRKIIIVDDSEELWKIKFILEEIASNIDDEEFIGDYYKSEILTCLVDCFEEESWYLKEKNKNPRKLKIVNATNQYSFNSDISFYFGYLNSKDCFIEPEWYKIIADELRNFALNSGRCKEETVKLLISFTDELLSEYQNFKNNSEFFKVVVEE